MEDHKKSFEDLVEEEDMLGPNSLVIAEEICCKLHFDPGMRVLDLGCGRGLASMYMASKFGVNVYAVDLYVSAEENRSCFKKAGLDNHVKAVEADACDLCFSEGYFDLLLSIDAYHCFGANSDYLDQKFAPLVKPGGQICVVVPGLKWEFDDNIPSELKPYWKNNMVHFHSIEWWTTLWRKSSEVMLEESFVLKCSEKAWKEWKQSASPYAREYTELFNVESGRFFNLVVLYARKK